MRLWQRATQRRANKHDKPLPILHISRGTSSLPPPDKTCYSTTVKYLLVGLLLLLLYVVLNRRNTPFKAVEPSWIGMVGLTGTAEQTFTTDGTITVNGEIWKATSKKGIVHKGDRVRVLAMNPGLTLEVETISPHA